jgi:hypothetical protein
VAGYAVEYGSTPYLLFQIGEYANIVLMCCLYTILFFGGWHPGFPTGFLESWPPAIASLFGFFIFAFKTVVVFFLVSIMKAIVPRYRYDQLMRLGWKVFLPTSLVAVVVMAAYRVFGRRSLDEDRDRAHCGPGARGCSTMKWNPYDPQTPDTAAGSAAAEQARSSAQTLCGPTGTVSQRDDTNGTRAGDWNCERPKP